MGVWLRKAAANALCFVIILLLLQLLYEEVEVDVTPNDLQLLLGAARPAISPRIAYTARDAREVIPKRCGTGPQFDLWSIEVHIHHHIMS